MEPLGMQTSRGRMHSQECIYQRTEAGRRAWEDEHSGLPAWYRRMLGLAQEPTTADELIEAMSDHPEKDVFAWLDQMESLGFIVRSVNRSAGETYEPVMREVAYS